MQHESDPQDDIDWSGPVENMERFAEYMRNQPPDLPHLTEGESSRQCLDAGLVCSIDPRTGKCTECGCYEHPEENHVHFAFDAARPGWTTPIYDVHGHKVSDPVPIDSLPRHGDERP
ncbi:hypothetical protein KHQ86_gp158 [Gordonia phage Stormageddon]|uniref:Uncharacterized protein n=1 Tax=Gordonia phage Stormageddon TaxID=2656541 RepID=A0A649VSU7_9CAUD|nr:hypothetical protein KHQ86_gp158 [Gordonia phage Stormageddon]QGJ95002.1 hypothetical protein SEA_STORMAGEDDON_142 [Gordonia phage Stormageddon]